jgi:hypothetical protein
VTAAAADLTGADAMAEARPEEVLTADAQLWAAEYLAKRVNGSVGVVCADGRCEWTFAVPADVRMPA